MKHIIWIFLFIVALSGCTTITPSSTPSGTPKATTGEKQITLKDLKNWQLSGKIAVQAAKDSGSASLDWKQKQDTYTISLAGPFGSHSMVLSGQPGAVTLQNSDGKRYHASSPEQLLAMQSGYHLPVSSMKYWIRGLPVPGAAANTHYDQSGRLATLIQQGWRIEYLGYTQTAGLDLPQKISLTSATLRLKIIVYSWQI